MNKKEGRKEGRKRTKGKKGKKRKKRKKIDKKEGRKAGRKRRRNTTFSDIRSRERSKLVTRCRWPSSILAQYPSENRGNGAMEKGSESDSSKRTTKSGRNVVRK